MKIAIVGAGSIGVAAAHALARDGHRVIVYEKNNAIAEEASFGHAGWITPALLHPWAVFGLGKAQRSGALPGSPARLRPGRGAWDASSLRWMWRWRKAERRLRDQAYPDAALLALERLAACGLGMLHALEQQWELDVERTRGSLVLLRGEADYAALRPALDALDALGQASLRYQRLDAAQTRALEPALAPHVDSALDFSHALYFADGAAANGRLIAQLQRQSALAAGAHFATRCHVQHLLPATGTQRAQLLLAGHDRPHPYDAIVVCTGADAAPLLAPLGLHLPLMPLHGYTINSPLRDTGAAPRHAVVHWGEQITLLRLGQRVRVAGGAELGRKASMHQPTLERLHHCANALLPGSLVLHDASVQHWHGSRVCTRDGLPLLGPSGLPGIWLNLGHGSCGAAIAQGCASALADWMQGRTSPLVDSELLQPRRWG